VKKDGYFQEAIQNTCIRQQLGFPLQFFESPLNVTFPVNCIGSLEVLRLGNPSSAAAYPFSGTEGN